MFQELEHLNQGHPGRLGTCSASPHFPVFPANKYPVGRHKGGGAGGSARGAPPLFRPPRPRPLAPRPAAGLRAARGLGRAWACALPLPRATAAHARREGRHPQGRVTPGKSGRAARSRAAQSTDRTPEPRERRPPPPPGPRGRSASPSGRHRCSLDTSEGDVCRSFAAGGRNCCRRPHGLSSARRPGFVPRAAVPSSRPPSKVTSSSRAA